MSRDPVFRCEGTSIPLVEQVELLGGTVDKRLNFKSHMKKICGKVSQQIAVWKRMNKLLSLKLLEKLHRAFIAPHFNYCAESWHFCSNLNRKTRKTEWAGTPLHSTLANQRLAKMLNTVFGPIGNGNAPTIFKLPQVNSTKYGIKSWRYQAAQLWNTIPNNVRNIDSYRSFKLGLKELNLGRS